MRRCYQPAAACGGCGGGSLPPGTKKGGAASRPPRPGASRRRAARRHFTLSTQIVMRSGVMLLTWMRTPRFLGILTPASGASAYQ